MGISYLQEESPIPKSSATFGFLISFFSDKATRIFRRRFILRAFLASLLLGLFVTPLSSPGADPTPTPAPAALPRPAFLREPAASLWDAAASGIPKPAYDLAICYRDGDGVPQDNAKAGFWFKRAADGGFGPAMRALGDACAQGSLGRAVDYRAARVWYGKGDAHLDIPSRFLLGDLMMKGLGGKADEHNAVCQFLSAGSSSYIYPPAAAALARLYATGDNVVQKDLQVACLWSLLASRNVDYDTETGKQTPAWMAENTALLRSLASSLPPAIVASLVKRGDALLACQARYHYAVVDDGAEETVTVPLEGASGEMSPKSPQLKVNVDFGDGKPHYFMVDTGVWFSEISSKLASQLQLTSVGQTSAWTGRISRIIAANCKIGGAEFQNLRFIEFPPANAAINSSMEGTLGANFFRLIRLQIDIRNHRLSFEPPGFMAQGSSIPITFDFGTPFVDATIESPGNQRFTVSALMDMGNWGGVIMNDDLSQAHPFESLIIGEPKEQTYIGADGKYKVKTAKIPALEIGPYHVDSPEFVYAPGHDGACSNLLNIGLPVWKQFLVTLDYPDSKVYLEQR